jgi:aspartate/methionine/tyrosine aminotransferase
LTTGLHRSPPTLQVNAWLFSDEIYRLLEQQPQQQRLQPAACAYPQRGISLGGLSKAFGLQGLRSGWLVCHDTALLQQVRCGFCCSSKNGISVCWLWVCCCCGLSKAFGLRGLRSGWLVCHDTALLQQVMLTGSSAFMRMVLDQMLCFVVWSRCNGVAGVS